MRSLGCPLSQKRTLDIGGHQSLVGARAGPIRYRFLITSATVFCGDTSTI
jgi:hypothetical protein